MGHHVPVPSERDANDAFRRWLEVNRLGDLADTLIANAIDSPAVLRLLNDDDFRELGLALGVRVRVREALRTSAGSNEQSPPAADGNAHARGTERRQVTVMFADVVGSTAMSTQVDPEDLAELLTNYHRRCIAVTENLEGTVARFLGDGVLAFFGFPEAHENDPARAVLAGLDIVNAVDEMGREFEVPIAVRVGIATGLTVVGEVLRSVSGPVTDVIGETPNLAARIQALARPGWVAIADSTRRLLGGAFDLEDLGAHQLKGLAAPARVFRALAPRRSESRFAAREDSDRGPLVGRQEELAEILAAWDACRRGQPASLLVTGEPGIGKSRLAYEVLQRADPAARCRIVLQCSSLHTTSPFFPVIEHMWRHLPPDAHRVSVGLANALADLAAARLPGHPDAIAVLSELVGVDSAADDAVRGMAPKERRSRTLATLARYVVGAGAEPTLVVVEDAHWADPSTIELIRHVATDDRRRLLLITARAGFVDPWTIDHHLRLGPLDAGESRALLGATAGTRPIDTVVTATILSRSAGVPLYVEELTRAVCEPATATGIDGLGVPPTLQDGLASRLDRLGGAKRVAQTAATFGRQFHRSLLAVVADVSDEHQLDRELDRLVEAGIIEAAPTAGLFQFRHALIHEVAYETMLRSTRRKMHDRIADAVRTAEWDPTIAPPALVAQHLQLAGRPLDAAAAWLAAAEQDSRRSAISEAVAHCDAGLEALSSVNADQASADTELRLCLLKAGMLRIHHGIGASDTLAAYERARVLCQTLGDDGRLVTTLTGLYSYYHQHDYRTAGSIARQLVEVSERRGIAVERMIAQRAMGVVHLHVGNPSAAVKYLSRALSLYDAERHAGERFLYGTDHAETAASFLALALWSSGRVAEAVDQVHWAVDHADALQHQPSIAQALVYRSLLGALTGHGADVVATTTRLEDVARGGLELFGIAGRFFHGLGIALQSSPCEGGVVMEEAEGRWRESGSDGYRPLRAALLARVALDCGQLEDGMRLVTEGLDAAERADERWTDAELHRVRGELQLRATDGTAALTSFRRAVAIASEQGSVMFQLRALVSLASILDTPPPELPTVLDLVHGECADVAAARQALGVASA